jgi:hypothetical protein
MLKLEDFNYGYEVEVISGLSKGEKGRVIYPISKTSLAIDTNIPPSSTIYNLRAFPWELKITSKENIYHIKPIPGLSFK